MSTPKNKALPVAFNARLVDPVGPMGAIPAGWHNVIISDSEVKINDNGNGLRYELEFTVIDGPFKGSKVFDGFNVRHSNATAMRIGAGQFSAICYAVKVFDVQQLSQLENIPFQIQVNVEGERTVDNDNSAVDGNGEAYKPGSPGTKTYKAKNRYEHSAIIGTHPTVQSGAASTPSAAPLSNVVPAGFGAPSTPPATATKPGAKRGRPPAASKPAAAPATAPVVVPDNRQFWLALDGDEFSKTISGDRVREMLAKGMPTSTGICLDGDADYKTFADYGLDKPHVAPVATTSAPITPPPTTTVAAAPAGGLPAWAQ